MVNPRVDVPRDDTVVARPASQILPESGAKHILKESSSEKAWVFVFFRLLLMPEKICLHRSDKHDKMSAEMPQYDKVQFGE